MAVVAVDSPVVVDIVLGLPGKLRDLAVSTSSVLVQRMREQGSPSSFQLGQRFPGGVSDGVCEPHVSLFMLRLAGRQIDELLRRVRSVADAAPAISAEGTEYRHNPYGAPELYFRKSAAWIAIQRAVVEVAEPLRLGQLRDTDPAGERLAEVIDRLRRDEPESARLRQLQTYGYDEIADRFHPHVTLAWPRERPADSGQVSLAGQPAAEEFSGVLTDLAVYGMNENGTCTTRYGGFPCAPLP